MWGWMPGMGWWMIINMVIAVIFIAGLIWLVVWGVRRTASKRPETGSMSPLEIAKQRYARGEITREQYEQLKKDLS